MNKLFITAILALALVLAPTAGVVKIFATDNNDDNDNEKDIEKIQNQQNLQQNQQVQTQKEVEQLKQQQAQQVKPDKDKDTKTKKENCKVKVQVKVLNAVNNTIYTAQLDDLLPQSKLANNTDTVAFNFQYKKTDLCPLKGGVEYGNVNGEQFAVLINSLTKPNKIGLDLAIDDQAAIESAQKAQQE